MKKSNIIFSIAITALSLAAFGFINWNNSGKDQEEITSSKITDYDIQSKESVFKPDFFYDVDTRFEAVKKIDLVNAKSINDFLPKHQFEDVKFYKTVKVIILDDYRQTDTYETGNSGTLTPAQMKLLQSANYSTNILIRADYLEKSTKTGNLQYSYFTPHLTIVPEKQAVYTRGKEALIDYLKENSKDETAIVQKEKLQSGKLYFTVTKEGTISNVKLATTSGYPSIDKTMIELVTKMPNKWEPAENSKGEKVDQKLVFSFGTIGC